MNKLESNRKNSKLSTGPRTAMGISKSSKNAIKHGTSKDVVLPSESHAEFDSFYSAMLEYHKPIGEAELNVVRRISIKEWRLRRLIRIETNAFANAEKDLNGNSIFLKGDLLQIHREKDVSDIFDALERGSGRIGLVMKYEKELENSTYKAQHELQRMQSIREGRSIAVPMALDIQFSTDNAELGER